MTPLLVASLPAVHLAISFSSASTAGRGRLRRQILCDGDAARGLVRLAQFVERPLAVDGAFAIGEEGLPRHALWIGDPLLVGLLIAAGGVFGFDDRALCTSEPVVDLSKLSLVLGLDTKMGDAGGAPPGDAVADIDVARMITAAGADCEVYPWVIEHPFGVVRLDDGRLGCEQRRIEPDRLRRQPRRARAGASSDSPVLKASAGLQAGTHAVSRPQQFSVR